jgi:hypothetical protein
MQKTQITNKKNHEFVKKILDAWPKKRPHT